MEAFADICVVTFPKEQDLLSLLLDEVLVDVTENRIVCVKPKASFVTLFQQVPGLEDGRLFSRYGECSFVVPDLK